MARPNDYLEHLRRVPLFAACSQRDLQKIAKASDELEIDAGQQLVEQGATGHEAFVILEGTARVERNGTAVAELGVGDHVGELALRGSANASSAGCSTRSPGWPTRSWPSSPPASASSTSSSTPERVPAANRRAHRRGLPA